MVDYESQFDRPEYAARRQSLGQIQIATTFKLVYGWMAAGLALSGLVAWYTAASGLWMRILSGPGLIACVVAELAMVFILAACVKKLPTFLAYVMFGAYAAVNGLTLSVVFIAYELALVQRVFFITAATFGGLAVFGTVTKSNLSGIGSVCGMALWGLIVASLVNLFMKSSGMDWLISFAGVIIFSGLTMYDAQKIRQMAAAEGEMDMSAIHKVAIMGALSLYLDFINLFLSLLRLFDKDR